MTTDADRVDQAVERSKVQITNDIMLGRVPAFVRSFGELHDYVDANCYGGLCDDDDPFWGLTPTGGDAWSAARREHVMGLASQVQDRVHAWLAAGRPRVDPITTLTRALSTALATACRCQHVPHRSWCPVWQHGYAEARELLDIRREPSFITRQFLVTLTVSDQGAEPGEDGIAALLEPLLAGQPDGVEVVVARHIPDKA